MGTNFYIRGYKGDSDPKTHIGKRSSIGNNKMKFIWAMWPEDLKDALSVVRGCPNCQRDYEDPFVVEDEAGNLLSLEEFEHKVEQCIARDVSLVGKEFS